MPTDRRTAMSVAGDAYSPSTTDWLTGRHGRLAEPNAGRGALRLRLAPFAPAAHPLAKRKTEQRPRHQHGIEAEQRDIGLYRITRSRPPTPPPPPVAKLDQAHATDREEIEQRDAPSRQFRRQEGAAHVPSRGRRQRPRRR